MNNSTRSSLNRLPVAPAILLYSVFLLFFLAGCSAVQDVTGYFNTYYNTKKLYTEAVDELSKSVQKDRDTNYFAPFSINKNVEDKFDKVIEKGSKIIQFYPSSSWVDDAILMIAKSYVYKGESESAIRKFDEFLSNFPESDLRFEAKLWYARAEYYSGREEVVLTTIAACAPEALDAGEEDIAIEGWMLAAQVHLDRQEYALAIEPLSRAVAISGDSKLRARAQFSMAESFETLGDDSSAANAYAQVTDFSPDPKFAFQSRLRHGMRLTASGRHDEAFDVLEELSDEDLLPEERGLVEVEVARTFLAIEDTAKAFPLFNYIDTTYKKSDPSARSAYFRGLAFEKRFGDYAQAGIYFDRARSENAAAAITPLAKRSADNVAKYLLLKSNLVKYDSLLYKALHPDTTKPPVDSLLTDPLVYSDSASGIPDVVTVEPPVREVDKISPVAASVVPQAGGDIADADLFFAGDEDPPRRGYLSRGGGPGGSRAGGDGTEKGGRQGELAGGSGRPAEQPGSRFAAGMRVPTDASKLTPDSLRSLMVQNRFELGGLFLLELEVPESAKVWYRSVVDDSSESVYKPRAYYALAEIYRAEHDTARVDSLYRVLIEKYAETEYGRYVRRSLGLAVADSTADSSLLAYAEAEKILNTGAVSTAVAAFKSVASRYKGLPAGTKALYTTGWIYENLLYRNDSAATYYKILVDSFPTSNYAQVAKPKLAVKEKPETLSQYVRITEIQPVARSSGTGQSRIPQNQPGRVAERNFDENSLPTQGGGRGNKGVEDTMDEEVDQPDEPEPEEPDPPEEEEEDPDDGGGGY